MVSGMVWKNRFFSSWFHKSSIDLISRWLLLDKFHLDSRSLIITLTSFCIRWEPKIVSHRCLAIRNLSIDSLTMNVLHVLSSTERRMISVERNALVLMILAFQSRAPMYFLRATVHVYGGRFHDLSGISQLLPYSYRLLIFYSVKLTKNMGWSLDLHLCECRMH